MNPLPQAANDFISKVLVNIVNPLIYLMFGVAFVVFMWGVTEYVLHLDDEDARKKGTQHMIWGVIGFFIMISAYGIVALIGATVKTL
ncbi:MAG: hypothetical protein WCT19_00950 [Candidatus Paceibacterota bacterium]|jgi:uncharacterized membrane protein YdjX (TVP38/TMEM64 family)